ncbi:Carboxymuconolactone decarboxylase protein [Azotobacter vinelandii CA]|uniref:Carboxymuconolactone decarboxylase protein n=2 Tax=Azotobacter vinelandii TaxID=354 RepID=C1DP42_AZOVD|nr:carboxymuconolactone decarboxylase family protein [Azotobacter vinelandii]ACO79395.1 Carboxymuconolactone decarboxylase protein [Azotobacter vinelandii DJ]AGK16396.1 Carboxymuconolactone decarboxylase protein [Azotobacter vinelandii CA]AGK21188.1 Carboxymuconolactone decarboxylase protein [Azotobacter vinelandii CA6]SFY22095.1 4-carboxymuconolactone decarboxylase [Azotobacter vinelandii]GLK59491.1 4-carboxymuconolactone decarboxylase [Azotobacter vinelandii]
MKPFPSLIPALLFATSLQANAQSAVPDTPAARQARETAPQLFAYTQDVLFGDVWKRKELAPRDRSLVTLSSLLANGQGAQMTSHINLALDNGVKPSEIIGLITHLAFYTGWPNGMSAVGVARDVFAKRGIDPSQYRSPSAELLPVDDAAEAKRAATVKANVEPVAPALARYTDDVLFADLWRRPDLTPRDRSLITVAALIARGQLDQVAYHLNRAMDSGLTQTQATEVVTHLAFYAGWPRAMSALPILQSVFAERK